MSSKDQIIEEEKRLFEIFKKRQDREYEIDPCEKGYVDFQRERNKKFDVT